MIDHTSHNFTPLLEPIAISEQVWPEGTLPFVATSTLTFNHESYIRECLDSILMQKTTFPVRICIFEDCSTDATATIIKEYINLYPQLFYVFFQPVNTWGKGEFRISAKIPFTNASNEAKYTAFCEGDDYWTDPYKLQKQVDFLEANEEYVLTFHPVKILKPDGILVEDFITNVPDNYELQETLARFGNYIHTPSVLYRNVLKSFPKEISLSPIGDFFIYMLLTEHGKIKMLEDTMGVYRFGVGIYSVLSVSQQTRKWNLTVTLLISAINNFEIKKVLIGGLFPEIYKSNAVVIQKNKEISFLNKTKRNFKLFLPPIIFIVKKQLFHKKKI